MAFRIEVTVNGGKPVVAGFAEKFYGLAATVSAGHFPEDTSTIGVNVGGMVRDTGISVNWLSRELSVGDEIHIRVLEDVPVSEPISRKDTSRSDSC